MSTTIISIICIAIIFVLIAIKIIYSIKINKERREEFESIRIKRLPLYQEKEYIYISNTRELVKIIRFNIEKSPLSEERKSEILTQSYDTVELMEKILFRIIKIRYAKKTLLSIKEKSGNEENEYAKLTKKELDDQEQTLINSLKTTQSLIVPIPISLIRIELKQDDKEALTIIDQIKESNNKIKDYLDAKLESQQSSII